MMDKQPEPRDAGAPALVYIRADRVYGHGVRVGETRIFITLKDEKNIVLTPKAFHYEDAVTGTPYDESGTRRFQSLKPQFGAVVVKVPGKDDVSFATYDDFITALRHA